MAPTSQKLKRLVGLLKREHLVNDRLNLMFLIEPHRFLEPILWSVDDPLQRDVSPQREQVHVHSVIRRVHLAGHIPDTVDQPTKGDGVKALPQGLGTTNLQDDVCAVVIGEAHHFFFPVGMGAVVDCVVGAEILGLGELGIGGGGDNYWG